MTRIDRPTTLATIAASAAFLFAACGGAPAASPLTDPIAILEAAATETAEATSVHFDLTADGELSLDLTGTGAAAPIQLTDSTVNGDLDIAGGDARVTFALPGLLGLRGELILVDGTGYLKTSLTGPKYRTIPMGEAAPTDPAASGDPTSMIDGLLDFLAQPELSPVKGEDVECGGTTCYTVQIELTPAELAALTSGGAEGPLPDGLPIPEDLPIPIPDLGEIGLDIVVRVEKDTNRLAGMTVEVSILDAAGATLEATFSKWDEDVTVTAPPADQVGGGI